MRQGSRSAPTKENQWARSRLDKGRFTTSLSTVLFLLPTGTSLPLIHRVTLRRILRSHFPTVLSQTESGIPSYRSTLLLRTLEVGGNEDNESV